MVERAALEAAQRQLFRRGQWGGAEAAAGERGLHIDHAAPVQQQRGGDQQPWRLLVGQPPDKTSVSPENPPYAVRYGATIAGSDKPARTEVIVGDAIGRPRRGRIDRSQ